MPTELIQEQLKGVLPHLNISYWILQSLAMALTCALIPRLKLTSIFGPILMVLGLAFVNSRIWDAALFFQIPDTFTSQAALLLISNGLIFWILVKLLPGIEVEGILPALVAPILFTLCSLLISQVEGKIDWMAVSKQTLTFIDQTKQQFSAETHAGSTK